jgi:hypothetical protein
MQIGDTYTTVKKIIAQDVANLKHEKEVRERLNCV